MERSKLARFLDNSTLGVLWMFFCYLTLKKYIANKILCLIITIALTFIFVKIIVGIQNKKYRKLGLKKSEEKQIENLTYYLKSQTKIKQNAFIKSLFSVEISSQKNQYFLLKNNTAILNKISQTSVNDEDIFAVISNTEFLKKNKTTEVAIICSTVNESAKQIVKNVKDFKISFITPDILFAIVKNKHYNLPQTEKTQIIKRKHEYSYLFCRTQAKNMLKVSIILYILSMIIPYSKHYVYIAFISFILSIILFIFGKPKQEEQKTSLLSMYKKENDNDKIETKNNV